MKENPSEKNPEITDKAEGHENDDKKVRAITASIGAGVVAVVINEQSAQAEFGPLQAIEGMDYSKHMDFPELNFSSTRMRWHEYHHEGLYTDPCGKRHPQDYDVIHEAEVRAENGHLIIENQQSTGPVPAPNRILEAEHNIFEEVQPDQTICDHGPVAIYRIDRTTGQRDFFVYQGDSIFGRGYGNYIIISNDWWLSQPFAVREDENSLPVAITVRGIPLSEFTVAPPRLLYKGVYNSDGTRFAKDSYITAQSTELSIHECTGEMVKDRDGNVIRPPMCEAWPMAVSNNYAGDPVFGRFGPDSNGKYYDCLVVDTRERFRSTCEEIPASHVIDTDEDSRVDFRDNCPGHFNPNQENADGDGFGDVCDQCVNDAQNDGDQDGLCADLDNCPAILNADQADLDGDNLGNVCDSDRDGDNILDIDEEHACMNNPTCTSCVTATPQDAIPQAGDFAGRAPDVNQDGIEDRCQSAASLGYPNSQNGILYSAGQLIYAEDGSIAEFYPNGLFGKVRVTSNHGENLRELRIHPPRPAPEGKVWQMPVAVRLFEGDTCVDVLGRNHCMTEGDDPWAEVFGFETAPSVVMGIEGTDVEYEFRFQLINIENADGGDGGGAQYDGGRDGAIGSDASDANDVDANGFPDANFDAGRDAGGTLYDGGRDAADRDAADRDAAGRDAAGDGSADHDAGQVEILDGGDSGKTNVIQPAKGDESGCGCGLRAIPFEGAGIDPLQVVMAVAVVIRAAIKRNNTRDLYKSRRQKSRRAASVDL